MCGKGRHRGLMIDGNLGHDVGNRRAQRLATLQLQLEQIAMLNVRAVGREKSREAFSAADIAPQKTGQSQHIISVRNLRYRLQIGGEFRNHFLQQSHFQRVRALEPQDDCGA